MSQTRKISKMSAQQYRAGNYYYSCESWMQCTLEQTWFMGRVWFPSAKGLKSSKVSGRPLEPAACCTEGSCLIILLIHKYMCIYVFVCMSLCTCKLFSHNNNSSSNKIQIVLAFCWGSVPKAMPENETDLMWISQEWVYSNSLSSDSKVI